LAPTSSATKIVPKSAFRPRIPRCHPKIDAIGARVSFTLPPAELEAFEQARVGVIRQGKTADQVDVAAAHMWRACLKAFLALPAKKRAALVWGVEPGKVGNPGAASS
jgi:hypothetical protein